MDLALPVNKLTKADLILIISIIFLSVVMLGLLTFHNSEKATGFEIKVDGMLHSVYSFSDLNNGDIIEIKTEYGYNKFLYMNNSVKCIETDCMDKNEMQVGSISKTNQILICLPHKLTVHILGENSIDAVSY